MTSITKPTCNCPPPLEQAKVIAAKLRLLRASRRRLRREFIYIRDWVVDAKCICAGDWESPCLRCIVTKALRSDAAAFKRRGK